MIKIEIILSADDHIVGFIANNHGSPIVCSAVSALTFNTINAIEAFTKVPFDCDIDEKNNGFLSFMLRDREHPGIEKADLLLGALHLGLSSIAEEYPNDILLKERRN